MTITAAALSAAALAGWVGCGSDGGGSSFSSGGNVNSGGNAGTHSGTGANGGTGTGASNGQGGAGGTLNLGDASGATGGSTNTDASCGSTQVTASPRQVNVLLVIDKSGSMLQTPTGFTQSKWIALKSALKATLDATRNSLDFGLELFPYQKDLKATDPITTPDCGSRCCELPSAGTLVLPVEDGTTAVPKIEGGLDLSSPSGATPTAAALASALAYFKGAGAALKGDRYVLLATDGGPNCNTSLTCNAATCTQNIEGNCPSNVTNCCAGAANDQCLDDAAAVAQVRALASAGVQTFVVGIPGSEKYSATLDALADAGGRARPSSPKYYAVTSGGSSPGGLTTVLQSIAQQLITTCRLQLTSPPPDPGLLNVQVDGQLVRSGPDGWTLDTSTSPATIVLQGATCTRVKTSGVQSVQVLYGCPTQVIE